MRNFLRIALVLGAVSCAAPAFAQPVQSYDFSDIGQPFMDMPFKVLRIETAGAGTGAKHIYRIADPFDKVVAKLKTMFEKGDPLSGFLPMGLSKQQNGEYQIIFGLRNEHHMAMVRPDGEGCAIEVDAFPVSFISGVYDIAIYGYSLYDDTTVSADKYSEE